MISEKQKKLNNFILKEAGLELDSNNHVVDQDTGKKIIVKGKSVKYNNGPIVRLSPGEIEFDPLNNPLLAHIVCTNYIDKLQYEGELETLTFGITNSERNTEGRAVHIGHGTKTASDTYNLDSLKYIDLIAKLNNTSTNSKDTIKLKSYDQKKVKRTRRK